ncbi:MAG TPA: bifunctional shikimate kinase/3-dehydroquinate synthase [Solirubrobacteraceae bacterium]|nr:bifunctional shikimate kinase/3-dehydroquinate synthase [Solirubrobacteraceae bacterium]
MADVAGAPARALVLIGFMGAGKTTVARELARALHTEAQDSDELLTRRLGHSPASEFEQNGEAAFRAAEEQLVCELLDAAEPGAVIALGGGSILSDRVRTALEPHVVVLLDVEAELAWQRVGGAGEAVGGPLGRPLARDREAFVALHGERRALYERHAHAFVPPLRRGDAAELLDALRALAAAPGGTRLIWAQSASGDYPVLVGRGLLRLLNGDGADELWPLSRSQSRAFLVTDQSVGSIYAELLGQTAGNIAIAPGEKTLATAEAVWRAAAAAGITRADHFVALGGGVVGDLAGFCAATYQRGVPIVQIPTTLVAQVDSAYGGKTGIDLPEAKNYVGAYHQPAGVIVDPDALETLPARELAAGWVEVLKTALIAGGPLWERVGAGDDLDEQIVLECARTKLAVVASDERDSGQRQVLNLGHTVGHAIETATGYHRYSHGEAVGLGLLAALRLSGADGLREQVRELLLARDLPVGFEGASTEAVVQATARDKKRVGDELPFVLLSEPGQARPGCVVAAGQLQAAVAELAQS